MRRRWWAASAVAALCAAGLLLVSSATSAAPAARSRLPKSGQKAPVARAAGGLDKVDGIVSGHVTNLTPYTWSLVLKSEGPFGTWVGPPLPATVRPTQGFDYQTRAYTGEYHVCCVTNWFFKSWVTYRADTPRGTEYLTIWVNGCWTEGLTNCGAFTKSTLTVSAYNTTAPYHTTQAPFEDLAPPGPATHDPAIGSTQSSDFRSDVLFQVQGNYALDAAKSPPELPAVLNLMCAGATGTSCSFTPTGQLTWGIGDLTFQGSADNLDCSAPPPKQSTAARLPTSQEPAAPRGDDSDWREVSITEGRETSLSLGESISLGAEGELFGVIKASVSVKYGIEREWADNTEIKKSVKIFLPSNYIGGVWTAPVVAKVTGTLVVKTNLASYTITNFAATKDGVSPDLKTPPFDVMTFTRPLTAAEYQTEHQRKCPAGVAGIGSLEVPRPPSYRLAPGTVR